MLAKAEAVEPLIFNSSPEPTIGVEMELWLVDPETRQLVPRAKDFLDHFQDETFVKKELWQCMVEINTVVCRSVKEARRDLDGCIARLQALARELGVRLISSGTHPISDWRDQIHSEDPRYGRLLNTHRWPASRLLISGLHVHVGVNSGEKAIAIVNSLTSYAPHMLAMSASSPFWHGRDTGLSSGRTKIFEGLPKAGLPHFLLNWAEFVRLMRTLLNSGTIHSIRDVWWDIRPHLGFGTVEVRVCDAMPTLYENIAMVAFVQALVVYLGDLYDQGQKMPMLKNWTLAENKWRAIRYGMQAQVIRNERGELIPMAEHLRETFDVLRPTAERLGSLEEFDRLERMIECGNSCMRQHRVFKASQSMERVVDHLAHEFETNTMLQPGEERSFCE